MYFSLFEYYKIFVQIKNIIKFGDNKFHNHDLFFLGENCRCKAIIYEFHVYSVQRVITILILYALFFFLKKEKQKNQIGGKYFLFFFGLNTNLINKKFLTGE